MIRHIFRKDWRLLWPLVALVTAIQVGFEWAVFKAGFFSDNHTARELVGVLSASWTVVILALAVAVVQEDPIPGAEQDWLIRPLPRTDLLLAKLLFVLVTVCMPMLALNLVHAAAIGFPLLPSLGIALYKEVFVLLCLLVPVMALASAARNMTELLVLAAALVVVYAAALGLSAILLGAEGCPTCETSIVWLQHLLQHAGVLAGAVSILILQYFWRRTDLSRALAVAGVLMLVFLQLPWRLAFAAQSWVSGGAQNAASVSLTFGESKAGATGEATSGASARVNLAGTTQALLHGNVGVAVEHLKRFSRPEDAPVQVQLPLQVKGLAPGEFLFADHSEFSLRDEQDRLLYRGTSQARASARVIADPSHAGQDPGSIGPPLDIPRAIYRRLRGLPVLLRVEYSLTLMAVSGVHRMSAVDGELRAPEVGLCRSRAEANEILIVCKQLGRDPICYSATLYSPDGRHNPDVLQCSADYRPYIPALSSILTVSAVELPTHDTSGLAHYAVDLSELPQSYIVLKSYAARAHFTRELPDFPLRVSEGVAAAPR